MKQSFIAVGPFSTTSHIYGPLIRNMQIMYENYSFMFKPFIFGPLTHTKMHINKYFLNIFLGFTKNETRKLVQKLQVLSVTGTVRICKTFMNFKV